MSHVPTVLKSDRSVFDKMLPVHDNGPLSKLFKWFRSVAYVAQDFFCMAAKDMFYCIDNLHVLFVLKSS